MKSNELSWQFVIDFLTEEGKPPAYINILDTIVFDSINSLRPLFWIYTSEVGELCKYNLRDWAIPEIIANLMHLYNTNMLFSMYLVKLNNTRELLENPGSGKIICNELQAIQIFTYPYGLEKNLYVHFYSDEEDWCYELKGKDQTIITTNNPVNFRIKAVSGLIMSKLKQLKQYTISSIKILYYVDLHSHDPWLAGFEDCKFFVQFDLNRSLLPLRDIKTRSMHTKPKNINLPPTTKNLSRGSLMIRGRHLLAKSEKETTASFKSSQNLREIFFKTAYPQLNESFPILPASDSYYDTPCQGQFCKAQFIKIPKHDPSIRWTIPFYLIELGQKSNYSPFIHSDLRKIPEFLSPSNTSQKNLRKHHFIKETSVCLKCYIVYNNIREKQKSNKSDFFWKSK
jgi:hypothetical protein